MGDRSNPNTGMDVQASPSRLTASMTWDQMATYHSGSRNTIVIRVLVNAVAVRQMRAFQGLGFSAGLLPSAAGYDDDTTDSLATVGAALQLPGGDMPAKEVPARWDARLTELQASPVERAWFRVKAIRNVDAHCIPCTVSLNGGRLDRIIEQELISVGSDRRRDGILAARTPFAEVDRLPLIFNECDSHAELLGLKSALLAACQKLAYGLSYPSPRQVIDRVFNGYQEWLKEADAALARTIARTQEVLAEAQKTGNKAQIVNREARLSILELYRSETATETPYDLTPGRIAQLYGDVSDIVKAP